MRAFLIISPSFITIRIFVGSCKTAKFCNGSPSTKIMSARKPSLSCPSSSGRIINSPPNRVAASSASLGVMPMYLTKYSRSRALVPCGIQANP
ncbi:hypothetical protein D3C77_576600 [compost metagenome]